MTVFWKKMEGQSRLMRDAQTTMVSIVKWSGGQGQ
jgi:hypothetical protein